MRGLRSSLILLTLCVGALLVSWLQLARDSTRLPVGTTYSTQSDGAQGLYVWAQDVGAAPTRLRQPVIPADAVPRVLLILQPESPIRDADQVAFADVPRAGGILILAGDSLAVQAVSRALGVPFEPTQITSAAATPEGDSLAIRARFRLRPSTSTPLLTAPNGDVLAVRQPYLDGTLIIVATPEPFTNAALRDPAVARFVYRQVLAPAGAQGIAFDEAHHSFVPAENQPATVNQLLFETAPGRAIVFAALVSYAFLLLGWRRLGPPLADRDATQTRRTMYEHVQMLASLYRRAGQFGTLRSAFLRHYQRLAARAMLTPTRSAVLDEALAHVQSARTEAELIAAVSLAERATSAQ